MAKQMSGTYESDKRVMLKVKHERECDCVVAGFRWHKKGERTAVGSLLLGLFDDDGELHHVGVCASFTNKKLMSLWNFSRHTVRMRLRITPGNRGLLTSWQLVTAFLGVRVVGVPVRIWHGNPCVLNLVVEVAYDHMQGSRFRHTAQFRRWRTDKKPSDCTFTQLEVVPPHELETIFA